VRHRLAEILAALSLASDLGLGAPLERGLRSCLVGGHLAGLAGLSPDEGRRLYFAGFLVMLGCTSGAAQTGEMFGDEFVAHRGLAPLVMGPQTQMLGWIVRNVGAGEPPWRRTAQIGRTLRAGSAAQKEQNAGHCEVARLLAERLGIQSQTAALLDFVFERWDGHGGPRGVKGESIPVEMRVGAVAYDVVEQAGLGLGRDEIGERLRRHAGQGLDPELVKLAGSHLDELLEVSAVPSAWDAVVAAEPEPHVELGEIGVDRAAEAVADFTDLKFSYLRGHSRAVAEVAAGAGADLGLDTAEVRRAALMHDLGAVTVSNRVWDRPGPLSDSEWEQVRLHAHWTERVLGRVPGLRSAAVVAGLHHERLDGSGYHRGATGGSIPASARVLAVAEVAQSLAESRPHRPARDASSIARELESEVRAGRLDDDAVAAVSERLGLGVRATRPPAPANLTDRELQVVRLVARGQATKQVAAALGISPKTADHHLQSVYGKTGIRTRAGLAVFAMENQIT